MGRIAFYNSLSENVQICIIIELFCYLCWFRVMKISGHISLSANRLGYKRWVMSESLDRTSTELAP